MYSDLYRLQLQDEEGMKANLAALAYEYTDDDEDITGIEWQDILITRTIVCSLPIMISRYDNNCLHSCTLSEMKRKGDS